MFDRFASLEPLERPEETRVRPAVRVLESGDTFGRFSVEPLEPGFGITVGNAMRRVLLSSVPGTAITWVRIEGILHEYSTIPGVKESVTEFLLNVKGIRIRALTGRTSGRMRLEVKGEGRVCAGDISAPADFEIVNPEHYLATLNSDDSELRVEFNVEQGKGYRPATSADGLPLGVLPVDAIFSPVTRVNYTVENVRVGGRTDYERLALEVWTDGTVAPIDAVRTSAQILVDHFFLLANAGKEPEAEGPATMDIPPEVFQKPLEELGLSPRTLNALKRARLSKVGEVLSMSREQLLSIRNFGDKSLKELYSALSALGYPPRDAEAVLGPEEEAPAPEEDQGETEE